MKIKNIAKKIGVSYATLGYSETFYTFLNAYANPDKRFIYPLNGINPFLELPLKTIPMISLGTYSAVKDFMEVASMKNFKRNLPGVALFYATSLATPLFNLYAYSLQNFRNVGYEVHINTMGEANLELLQLLGSLFFVTPFLYGKVKNYLKKQK